MTISCKFEIVGVTAGGEFDAYPGKLADAPAIVTCSGPPTPGTFKRQGASISAGWR